MSGGVLRLTVIACAALASAVAVAAGLTGHLALGIGVAAGLLVGSLNGFLIEKLLGRGTPFLASSLMRLVFLSLVAVSAALLFRSSGWTVPLGIGVAQLVMVGAGVRQGLRA
ncbi:MAG TPA: hypothetical protein VEW68_09470 [Patescibacteria group bacterium]|nr:hypothetical protein [Patescibacteria group bacterium]